jgi:hypothetical protein
VLYCPHCLHCQCQRQCQCQGPAETGTRRWDPHAAILPQRVASARALWSRLKVRFVRFVQCALGRLGAARSRDHCPQTWWVAELGQCESHGFRSGFDAIPENAENAIQWVQIGPSALEAVVGSASMPVTGPTLSGLHLFAKTGIGCLLFGYLFANGRLKETVGPGRPRFAIQISRHCAWIQIITADSRTTLTLTKDQTDRAGHVSMRAAGLASL